MTGSRPRGPLLPYHRAAQHLSTWTAQQRFALAAALACAAFMMWRLHGTTALIEPAGLSLGNSGGKGGGSSSTARGGGMSGSGMSAADSSGSERQDHTGRWLAGPGQTAAAADLLSAEGYQQAVLGTEAGPATIGWQAQSGASVSTAAGSLQAAEPRQADVPVQHQAAVAAGAKYDICDGALACTSQHLQAAHVYVCVSSNGFKQHMCAVPVHSSPKHNWPTLPILAPAHTHCLSGTPLEMVAAVFITRSTSKDLIAAVRDGAAAFNAHAAATGSGARATLVFFVGNNGHPLKDEPGGAPDIVVGGFVENMNGGKTYEWWAHAAKAYPNASFVFKVDTDTSVKWPRLAAALPEALANATAQGTPMVLFGHRNDHEACGRFSHCPPKGCTDIDGDCWVYMSGGFYGMSGDLVRAVGGCSWAAANKAGFEDMRSGQSASHCAGRRVHVAHVRNGIAWCHSKKNTADNIRSGTFPEGCGVW